MAALTLADLAKRSGQVQAETMRVIVREASRQPALPRLPTSMSLLASSSNTTLVGWLPHWTTVTHRDSNGKRPS